MTKGELLRVLDPFMDETEIVVWVQGQGEAEILKTSYVPAKDKAAFVHLVARRAHPTTGESHGE
ncbi:MAG TPA: hypothetical protein VFB54_12005 [Burkholderiales bacterium]|nr:hypothetical protein [Burkholderiales bacterium]